MTEEAKTVADKPAKKTPVIDVNDIDASWDGKESLDAHREKALKSVKQPGFGSGKVKTDGE